MIENFAVIYRKRPNRRVFHQKDANGIANSEDPDQTAPLGAVRSGSALFARTYSICPKTLDHYGKFKDSVYNIQLKRPVHKCISDKGISLDILK